MKRIIFIATLITTIIIAIPSVAFAAEHEYSDEISQYDLSCFGKLGDEANDVIEELGLDSFDYNSLTSLSFDKCIDVLMNLIKENITMPLKSISVVLCFCILSAFLSSFAANGTIGVNSNIYSTASSLVIAVVIAGECAQSISLSCTTISICSDFVFAFIPIFFTIVAVSGGTITSMSTNSLLLILAQGLNYLAANIFVPLINCFLALGICSGLRSELNVNGLVAGAKKLIITFISICSGGFVAILSLKTAVASRADALGLRSLRFAINSVVPVIGSAISEGLLSIQSYSGLIKSSVGVVGIIGVFALFLPAVINVLMWRLCLYICRTFSEIFDDVSVCRMLDAFSNAFLLINVILILTMVTTIISIGVLIAAKTTVG